ncbi:MFS transporter [Streptomyces telluris]|uniref:MFS transporter n=1 Tax=Streptomyces telluris TaxID=2720021 RepID=A0A9X2RPN3_9ACTN|nr:MFS transporter [Streptomyces telluris]MCQ8774147.1 MFS transporter [Streptomyces telluris]NJP76154.1 MFS transporter [Streptomyces telluris]
MGGTTLVESDGPVPVLLLAPQAAPAPPAPPEPPAARGRLGVALAGLLLALFLAALDQTVVATALPAIAGDLHGAGRAAWIITAYLLGSAVAVPVHGRLGEIAGRKGVFAFALVLLVAGSALAARAQTMDQLLAFRTLQGIGGGGVLAAVHAIIADLTPARERRRRTGAAAAVLALASLAGPPLGGLLTDHASWRWCFHLNVPLGLIALLAVTSGLRLPRPARRARFDTLGALLLVAFSVSAVLLADRAGTAPAWHARVVLGLAAATLGTALLFIVVEHLAADPLVPPRLLRDRTFLVCAALGAGTGAALFGAVGCLPTFLQTADGAGAVRAGLLLLPLTAGAVLGSLLSGRFARRTRHCRLYAAAGCAAAAAGAYALSRLGTGTTWPAYALATAALGAGTGLALPALARAVRNAVPAADLAAAGSAGTYLRQLGGALAVASLGALLAHRLAGGPDRGGYARAYADAAPRTFLYLVPVLVLGLLLAFLLKEKPPVSQNLAEAPVIPSARTAPPEEEPPFVPGIPVTGVVQHHDGTTVPRAALTLIDSSGRQIGRGATGEDGRYALSTPGTGSYVLIAAAGGHQPQAVTVTVGERPVELDVVLGGAGRLAGTVLTADGSPVRDALVTLTNVHGEVVASTRTGRDGGYDITELVAGEYTLAGSAPVFRPAALPVTVQSCRETRQDIELAGGAVLRGVVRAGGGRLVEDARVTLLDAAGNVVDTATTGPDGAFRFVDLSAGEYTVIAAGYPPVATVLQVAGGGRTERDLQLGHAD